MSSQKILKTETSVIDAINHRRAVRDYLPQKIEQTVIRTLLDAATHAPTAMHEEPWSFVVIQDKNVLNRLSDSAKKLICSEEHGDAQLAKHGRDFVKEPSSFIMLKH